MAVCAAFNEAGLYDEVDFRLDSDGARLLVKIKGVGFAVRLSAADQDIAEGLKLVASMRPRN
jgi:hypothetical protein